MSDVVEQYENGGEKLRHAVRGLSEQELRWTPPKDAGVGLWSIHQILVHLQDAETAFADRVRRIVAEENPVLQAWDETKFADRLSYERQSSEDATALIELMRRQLSRVLRSLPPADLQRAGMHSEAGRQIAAEVLAKAVWHLDHHLSFVHKKRAKMGKEI